MSILELTLACHNHRWDERIPSKDLVENCREIIRHIERRCAGILEVIHIPSSQWIERQTETLLRDHTFLLPFIMTKVQFMHRTARDFLDTEAGSDILRHDVRMPEQRFLQTYHAGLYNDRIRIPSHRSQPSIKQIVGMIKRMQPQSEKCTIREALAIYKAWHQRCYMASPGSHKLPYITVVAAYGFKDAVLEELKAVGQSKATLSQALFGACCAHEYTISLAACELIQELIALGAPTGVLDFHPLNFLPSSEPDIHISSARTSPLGVFCWMLVNALSGAPQYRIHQGPLTTVGMVEIRRTLQALKNSKFDAETRTISVFNFHGGELSWDAWEHRHRLGGLTLVLSINMLYLVSLAERSCEYWESLKKSPSHIHRDTISSGCSVPAMDLGLAPRREPELDADCRLILYRYSSGFEGQDIFHRPRVSGAAYKRVIEMVNEMVSDLPWSKPSSEPEPGWEETINRELKGIRCENAEVIDLTQLDSESLTEHFRPWGGDWMANAGHCYWRDEHESLWRISTGPGS